MTMPRFNTKQGWATIGLLAYAALLIVLSVIGGDRSGPRDLTVRELQSSHHFLSWLLDLVLGGLLDALRFLPVGILAAFALFNPPANLWRRALMLFLAAGVALLSTFAIRGFEVGSPWVAPGSLDLMLPVAGCLLGVWIGSNWLRGWRARLWLIPKLAVLALLLLGAPAALLLLAIEQRPSDFEGARVTSAEKRRLVRLLREKSSLRLHSDEKQTLNLTEHDVDVLLAWGLSIGSDTRKAKVNLQPEALTLNLSMGLPSMGSGRNYLNLRLRSRLAVDEGRLDLKLRELRLGRLNCPAPILDAFSPLLATTLRHDRRVRPFLKSIEQLQVEPDGVKMTYGKLYLPEGFFTELTSPGGGEEVLAATRAQIEHLRSQARRLPGGRARFGACLETAFGLARERSQSGDPVIENRAAIYALAIVLGHPHLARFIGPAADSRTIQQTQRALGRVSVRGRTDWTRHFLVSAALALLSAEAVSDAAGLLKEELDAGSGGSGFSFADFLADRAGTTFALAATRNQAAARAMQERLARGFEVDAFFPPAADLPEGLSDAELQARYGGVGGQGYQRLVAEIERRIAACEAYR